MVPSTNEQPSALQTELTVKAHEFIDFLRKNAPILLFVILGALAAGKIATQATTIVNAVLETVTQRGSSYPHCSDDAVAVNGNWGTASGPALGVDDMEICQSGE